MQIVKASEDQFEDVRAFYFAMIDGMKSAAFDTGWKKDIYPDPEFLMSSLRAGELYIGVDGEKIVASMVTNHDCNESYADFQWPTKAAPEEVTVVHVLAVLPDHARRGLGRQMMEFVIDTARRSGQKAVRLDVLPDNYPAKGLYESLGFSCLHTLKMYYENTGWMAFELHELSLENAARPGRSEP